METKQNNFPGCAGDSHNLERLSRLARNGNLFIFCSFFGLVLKGLRTIHTTCTTYLYLERCKNIVEKVACMFAKLYFYRNITETFGKKRCCRSGLLFTGSVFEYTRSGGRPGSTTLLVRMIKLSEKFAKFCEKLWINA